MAKVTKLADKLTKVGECINVYFYDNAYMVEANGRDENEDWVSVKLICLDLDGVQKLLQEADTLPRDN